MSYGELTSRELASLASRAMQNSYGLTELERKQLAGSALTQVSNKPGGPVPGEQTSKLIGSLASKGLRDPMSLTEKEIKALAGSVLTQAPNR